MPTTAPMAPRKSARLASKNLTPMRPSISKSPKKTSVSEKSSPLKRQGAIRRKDHPKVTKKLGKKKVLGARQSPIDIRKELVQEDVKNCQASCLKISYTLGDCTDVLTCPTGFRVNVAEKCSSTLKAKHLPGTYLLAQFHAHWGRDCSCGAEHLLDGMSKAGEVHFVFWNKKYGSFEKALEQGDGLAVLGVLLEEGAHSTSYESLFDVIKRANSTKKTVTLPANFALDELIPKEGYRDFATYLGSLTTPPYCESVIWTVFFEPMIVSKSQLDILRAITPSNYRECQNLKGRIVSSSRKL